MPHTELVESLLSELESPKRFTASEKALLLSNVLFSCTLSGFAMFLGKQQALRLCKENLHCSDDEAWFFFIPNGISNSLVVVFTSSQIFSAVQRAFIGKNNAFYGERKNHRKEPIQLTLSMFAGLLAAIPIMLSTRDPVGSKLAFIANFIMATYSFYSIARDLSAAPSNNQPNVKAFLQMLKSYELRQNNVTHKHAARWLKILAAICLPLFYNGPFCIHNILFLNNPDNNLGILGNILPENQEDRLITSILLGTTFTIPWLILAGIFGYHLPDTLLEQFYQNPFAQMNPTLNMSLQITQGLVSLGSFALPVKFFLDIQEELFDFCGDGCIFLTVLIAISGALFSLLPNLKIAELMIIFWNLFLSSDLKKHDETFDIINARTLATQFKTVQVALPAEEVDDLSRELIEKLPSMTEHTSLLQYQNNKKGKNNLLTDLDPAHNKLDL